MTKLTFGDIDSIQAQCKQMGLRDPLVAYADHQRNAYKRQIDFKMTFSEWWGFWSEHYTRRGGESWQLCMARIGDEGAYEVGNVYIATQDQNRRDYLANPTRRSAVKTKRAEQKKAAILEMVAEIESLHGPHLPFELRMLQRSGAL